MARQLSTGLKKNLTVLADKEKPVFLLELNHPSWTDDIRLVQDNKDLISNGLNYLAVGFNITLPDDVEKQIPRCTLEVENVGGPLAKWVDQNAGGKDVKATIKLVRRSTPNLVEMKIPLSISSVRISNKKITAQLSFENILRKVACRIGFTQEKAPGLYT